MPTEVPTECTNRSTSVLHPKYIQRGVHPNIIRYYSPPSLEVLRASARWYTNLVGLIRLGLIFCSIELSFTHIPLGLRTRVQFACRQRAPQHRIMHRINPGGRPPFIKSACRRRITESRVRCSITMALPAPSRLNHAAVPCRSRFCDLRPSRGRPVSSTSS